MIGCAIRYIFSFFFFFGFGLMDTCSLKKYLNMSDYTGYHHTFVSKYCFVVLMELVSFDFLVDFLFPQPN